jgi:hypothetical protein
MIYDEAAKKWRAAAPGEEVPDYSVASKVYDYYEEMTDVNAPGLDEVSKRLFMKIKDYKEKMMPAGTTMVPRVFKTNVGDIFTTNTINATAEELTVGKTLTPGAKGILEVTEATEVTEVPEETKNTAADKNVVLKLKRTDIQLGVYYQFQLVLDCALEPEEVTWSSEHPHIATVDEKGNVTAVKAGTTAIIAKYGDQEVQCIVRCK